jgi:carbon monoxide dehydrogenase subunit G
MRFEHSIDINAPQAKAWAVVSDVQRWPERTASITSVELQNNPPFGLSSHVRIRQPKLPVATWTVTRYDPPSFFEWVNKSPFVTTTAGHRVVPTGDLTCRLTLTLEWRGIATPLLALLYRKLTDRYLTMECEGMKRAAESN